MSRHKKDPDLRDTALITYSVGNTNTRLTVWNSYGEPVASQQIPTAQVLLDSQPDSSQLAEAAGLGTSFPILISGVVPAAVAALTQRFKSLGKFEVHRFRESLPCPLQIRPQPPEGVGDDRLAAALGALALDERSAWIILDSGTALTLDRALPTPHATDGTLGIFEGGLILPGEALALRALHEHTGQLPLLEPWPATQTPPPLGLSTREALCSGVRLGQLGAVRFAIQAQLRHPAPLKFRIAVTGGGGPTLLPLLLESFPEQRPVLIPDLVERGLFRAWEAGQAGA